VNGFHRAYILAHAKLREETEKEIAAKACEEVGTMATDLTNAGRGEASTTVCENEGAI
jgi:hypothetical protein